MIQTAHVRFCQFVPSALHPFRSFLTFTLMMIARFDAFCCVRAVPFHPLCLFCRVPLVPTCPTLSGFVVDGIYPWPLIRVTSVRDRSPKLQLLGNTVPARSRPAERKTGYVETLAGIWEFETDWAQCLHALWKLLKMIRRWDPYAIVSIPGSPYQRAWYITSGKLEYLAFFFAA